MVLLYNYCIFYKKAMFKKEDFDKLNNFKEIQKLSPSDFEWFSKFLLQELGHTNVRVTPPRFD